MRTIEITTTQNVTIRYELADLKDRALAWTIDISILAFGGGMISMGLLAVFPYLFGGLADNLIIIFLLSIFLFYTLVQEVYFDGRSIGKRSMGLKVVKLDGKQPTNTDYIIRWLFRSIDIYFSVGSLGALLISSSSKSQRLGGMLSNTAVIKMRPTSNFTLDDILKINSIGDYEPTYPDIRHASEADMLLIKNALERTKRYSNNAHHKALNELSIKMTAILDLPEKPKDNTRFLRTLVSDYVVLTR